MPTRRSHPTRSRPGSLISPAYRVQRLQRLRRLTVRDRQLLAWLAEHYVLAGDQIGAALFPTARLARRRLATLHELEAVTRFVDVTTGTRHHLYTLGPLGMLVEPSIYHDPARPDARPARTSIERTERIIGSRRMSHLLGTNRVFCDLLAHARTQPGAELARWWSEQHASAAFAFAGIHPDGHGVWTAGGRHVGFFLEHDTGSETLGVVLAKLGGYQRLATFGPRYPVLLHLPGRRREAHLLDALAGVATAMPVATAVHGDHPAGPVWALPADPQRRYRLEDLPSDDGPDNSAANPHRFTAADPADTGWPADAPP